LVLMRSEESPNPFLKELRGDSLLPRKAAAPAGISGDDLYKQYEVLGLNDVYLSYAGRFPQGHAIHAHLSQLQAEDKVFLAADSPAITICDKEGFCVGRLSKSASDKWKEKLHLMSEVRVVAMVERDRMDQQKTYKGRIKVEKWEVPVLEVVFA
jgi:ATP-dependent DNA helicase RecQ